LRILVFTRTAEFRRASIPTGVATRRELASADGILVDHTEAATANDRRSNDRIVSAVAPRGGSESLVALRHVLPVISTTNDGTNPAGSRTTGCHVRPDIMPA